MLQKNAFPVRASNAVSSLPLVPPDGASSTVPNAATDDNASERNQVQQTDHTPERPTRQSRRLRGEESIDIPSFSTPIEKIIRCSESRRKRDHNKKSEDSITLGKLE